MSMLEFPPSVPILGQSFKILVAFSTAVIECQCEAKTVLPLHGKERVTVCGACGKAFAHCRLGVDSDRGSRHAESGGLGDVVVAKVETPAPKLSVDDMPIVPPPATFVVSHEHKPVLFTADWKALVRRCGF